MNDKFNMKKTDLNPYVKVIDRNVKKGTLFIKL